MQGTCGCVCTCARARALRQLQYGEMFIWEFRVGTLICVFLEIVGKESKDYTGTQELRLSHKTERETQNRNYHYGRNWTDGRDTGLVLASARSYLAR